MNVSEEPQTPTTDDSGLAHISSFAHNGEGKRTVNVHRDSFVNTPPPSLTFSEDDGDTQGIYEFSHEDEHRGILVYVRTIGHPNLPGELPTAE